KHKQRSHGYIGIVSTARSIWRDFVRDKLLADETDSTGSGSWGGNNGFADRGASCERAYSVSAARYYAAERENAGSGGAERNRSRAERQARRFFHRGCRAAGRNRDLRQ